MSWSYTPANLSGGYAQLNGGYSDWSYMWGMGALIFVGVCIIASIALAFAVQTKNVTKAYVVKLLSSGTTVSSQTVLTNTAGFKGTWTAASTGVLTYTATEGPDLTKAYVTYSGTGVAATGASVAVIVTATTTTIQVTLSDLGATVKDANGWLTIFVPPSA